MVFSGYRVSGRSRHDLFMQMWLGGYCAHPAGVHSNAGCCLRDSSLVQKMQQSIRKNNRKVGTDYEQAAGYYLEQQGYVILEYNYRCRIGEIDLIARDGEYLVFCEVKFRRDRRKGSPLDAVGVKKQRTLYQCALHYLSVHRIDGISCRFDVIGIEGGKVTHIRNAFEG